MNLNKMVLIIRKIMARKNCESGKAAILNNLRVQLNPVVDKTHKSSTRKKSVQQLIGMMIADLHRRGRPRKTDEGDILNAA